MYNIFYNGLVFLSEFLNESSFIVIVLNIIVYIFMLINIFLLLFLFDTKMMKSTNQFKLLGNIPMVSILLVVMILSLAGMPPFVGFLSKFLIFIYLFSKSNLLLFVFFLFVNLFIIYFYIQNIRFMITKTISTIFLIKFNFAKLNTDLLFNINMCNYINILFIFYIEEFTVSLFFLNSHVYF